MAGVRLNMKIYSAHFQDSFYDYEYVRSIFRSEKCSRFLVCRLWSVINLRNVYYRWFRSFVSQIHVGYVPLWLLFVETKDKTMNQTSGDRYGSGRERQSGDNDKYEKVLEL